MQWTYITMEISKWVKHVEPMKVNRTSSTHIKTADNTVSRKKVAQCLIDQDRLNYIILYDNNTQSNKPHDQHNILL